MISLPCFLDGTTASNGAKVLGNSGDLPAVPPGPLCTATASPVPPVPGFCRRAHRWQVGIGTGPEGILKLPDTHLPVLAQNVGIHTGDPVDLGIARITLGGLQVAVVQL